MCNEVFGDFLRNSQLASTVDGQHPAPLGMDETL